MSRPVASLRASTVSRAFSASNRITRAACDSDRPATVVTFALSAVATPHPTSSLPCTQRCCQRKSSPKVRLKNSYTLHMKPLGVTSKFSTGLIRRKTTTLRRALTFRADLFISVFNQTNIQPSERTRFGLLNKERQAFNRLVFT